jgi:hypothetical protein
MVAGGLSAGLLGLVAGETSAATLPACTTSSTTTCAAKLTLTAGSFQVHGNTESIPPPGSITGKLDPKTGNITAGTLSRLAYHLSPSPINTHSTETIIITQVAPGTGTGSVNYLGDVSYVAALQVLVTIHQPVREECLTTPIPVTLASTTPYASDAVTISQVNFTIPNFVSGGPTGCRLAANTLNKRYSGDVNEMSLSLTGALPLPPPPAKPTTTLLTVSPASPVLTGTKVTLTASVAATVGSTPAPTGHVTFKSGATVLGASSLGVHTGTDEATLTTTNLPAKPTQPLTAVYSGDTKYGTSTSSSVKYSVQPKPTVSTNLPVTAIRGTSTPTTFNVRVTNPPNGESWPSLKLALLLRTIPAQTPANVALTYENATHVWCKITLSGSTLLTGTFKGLTGACGSTSSFSLGAGQSLTIPFRIKFAPGANIGAQTSLFYLETLNGTGAVVAPFTTVIVNGKPVNAPYAEGLIHANPATKYPVTVGLVPTGTVPQGYILSPGATLQQPNVPPYYTTTNTIYPPIPTGTVRFLVTGHTFTPPAVSAASPGSLDDTRLSTKGLSVGTHTLTAVYSGDGVYNPAQKTATFTVIADNPGTVLRCYWDHTSTAISGSVVASAALPTTTNNGSVTANLLAVTLYVNNRNSGFLPVTNMKISFTPGGSVTVPTVTQSSAGPTKTFTVSRASATVTGITGNLGTVVPVGVSSLFLKGDTVTITCTSVTQPAPLGSVVVSGVTLSASPASPVAPGTTVTLAATVAPATKGGQVTFFDGTTVLGSAVVPTSGPTKGVAKLTDQPLLGAHTYQATWSGTVPTSVSNTVSYSVETAPVVTTQPAASTVNQGTPLTFTAAATGNPVPTVAWQQSTDGGSTWAPAAGTVTTKVTGTTRTSTLTIASATKTDASTQFRAVFTNGAGTATTNVVTPTVVIPPTVVTQPANQAVVAGSTASFTAKATGTVLKVQWQESSDGGKSWSNAPGTPSNTFASATTLTSTYTTPATTTANNGAEYQAVFSNGAGKATSNAATLTVTATPPPPAPPAPPTPPAPPVTSGGYNLVASNGSVYSYGTAPFYGSMGGKTLSAPIVGTASTPGDGGYWLVGSDGGIFSFGNAKFYGSMGGQPLNKPIVGMAATPTGGGYWEVASDGGIFSFGNAKFYGSTGGMALNKPIVGMAATPTGGGYWLVASDGGIFSFGNAKFYGSTGSLVLNKPIVGMAATPTGGGYWLVASDGGIFSFGNAGFHGTVAGTATSSIVGLSVTPTGGGYWEVGANGQVYQFGDAALAGTAFSQTATIVAISG